MIEAALRLAQQGFRVFPLKRGAKAPPLVKDFPRVATSDKDQVRKWWDKWPSANVGVEATGMIVLDVDPKKGGDESFAFLEMTYGLPETLTTRTPTGGRHLYYRAAEPVPNGVDCLGPGLDIRSRGGYVVAPGSEVPAGRYVFERDIAIADAPDWLVAKLGTIVPKSATVSNSVVVDAPDAVLERAREWLLTAERSVKGGGGDQAAYRVACHLRDLGVSEQQAVELMRSDAWDHGCGWRDGWLERKPIRSAYRYAQNEPGTAAVTAEDFPVVQDLALSTERGQAREVNKPTRLAQFAIKETVGPGYLIKGLLQRRSYAELFGAPGAGKTFVALDMAYHVAAGQPWMGRRVHPGTVLYLAYEGTGGMVKRAQALRQKYGDADVPLYIASAAFSLREASGRAAMAQVLTALPEKPALIVIDTFARALMGGDENSAQDVGAFNSAIAALIESTGACVMIIHHSGKNKNAGARGSSALLGAIDTELEVDDCRVTASKQRDVEVGEPIGFKLAPVVVGLDEDGEGLTSCVVEPDVARKSKAGGKLTGHASRGFDVLCRIRPTNDPVTDMEWRENCLEFLPARKAAFWDLKSVLLRRGFIVVDEAGLVTRKME